MSHPDAPSAVDTASQPDWFAIALGVTPPFPCSVVALRDDGAPVRLTLTGTRDGLLSAQTAVFDARKGQTSNSARCSAAFTATAGPPVVQVCQAGVGGRG